MHHRPTNSPVVSVSVAIACATTGGCSFACRRDEPTGNLDSQTSEEIMRVFEELAAQGQTVVMVTHEPDIAVHAKQVIVLRDGVISSDETREQYAAKITGERVQLDMPAGGAHRRRLDTRIRARNEALDYRAPSFVFGGARNSRRGRPYLSSPSSRARRLMHFFEAVRLALITIRVQKLKSASTLLGVCIGVMFLISVVSIVEGWDATSKMISSGN